MELPSSPKPCLLWLFVFCLLNVSTIISQPLKQEAVLFGGKFQALYVIGDSLVDSGNNNYLSTKIKANFAPYGSDFEGGKPTGRFSNGKTIADYIAIYYGLPLAPAYKGLSEEEKNKISTGINYASASCGIFPETGKQFGECLSLSAQVGLFKKTIDKNMKKRFKTKPELRKHLAESLFMSAIGINDYVFFFNNTTDPNEFAKKLLHDYLKQIQKLQRLGARKFFINNLKPLGCYPNIIAHTVPTGSCNNGLNLAISIFNTKLRKGLTQLKKKFANTSFLYSDYFNFMLELRGPSSNQASSNLMDSTSPCCPSVYDGGLVTSCRPDSIACKMPDSHIFFDPFHPTQLANFMYAIECFQERTVCEVV
ncbi:GDSL esterase/lipase At2g03980-like [Raphanus sativus]|uniref:GDSL esterase/lipase At2g03980-like n=1 Tax=Raphanus sativus TaxID=3726 RepID=A0A6J0LBL3_RAPSA|nr:GDSL esterase/lipase At2g03980-like [Raphanus sativus]